MHSVGMVETAHEYSMKGRGHLAVSVYGKVFMERLNTLPNFERVLQVGKAGRTQIHLKNGHQQEMRQCYSNRPLDNTKKGKLNN